MRALQIFAGPVARVRLRERGLAPGDARVIPAAAGGPKGLVLSALDRWLFGDYIGQRYEHAPGRVPAPSHVSEVFAKLAERFAGREAEVLTQPRYRLHVFTSRGRHLLGRESRCTYRTRQVALDVRNLCAATLAIAPGWLDKALLHRHRASARLANVVVLAPHPDWVCTLPDGKLPDRSDFKAYADDVDARMAVWRRATAEGERLAGEFADAVRRRPIETLPL